MPFHWHYSFLALLLWASVMVRQTGTMMLWYDRTQRCVWRRDTVPTFATLPFAVWCSS